MKRPIRCAAFACLLASASFAALAAPAAAPSNNPLARSEGFHSPFGHGPLDRGTGIARPTPRFKPVTPIPEPSEWLTMAAGLAVVGFIVRRRSRRE